MHIRKPIMLTKPKTHVVMYMRGNPFYFIEVRS